MQRRSGTIKKIKLTKLNDSTKQKVKNMFTGFASRHKKIKEKPDKI
jgi:hypothetical protein